MESNWQESYASLRRIREKDNKTDKAIYELFREEHFLGNKFYKPLLREIGRSAKNSLDIPFLREQGIYGLEQILDMDYPYSQDIMGLQDDEKKVAPLVGKPGDGKEGKFNTQVENMTNSVIIQGNNTVGNITIGDAASRQEDAQVKISFEIKDNFSELAKGILAIEVLKPEPFWDKRKVNETEQNYQTRAEYAFLKYKERLTSEISQKKYSRNIYLSFKNQITDKNVLEKLEHIYNHFDEVICYMHSYDSHLNHLLGLNIDDKRRHADCLSKYREILATMKIHLLESAAYYFAAFDDNDDGAEVLLCLSSANICVAIAPGQKAFSQCYKKVAEYAREKTEILRERIEVDKNSRHLDPNIHDPYIAMLRKTVGLGEALSESELRRLRNSEIDMDETDPQKLFKLAAYSYMELDGEASIIYFQRILELTDIAPIHKRFAENSLHRLKNPDFYQGALGILVIDLNKNGGLERAGVQVGDIIISINGQPFLEPFDLSSALANERGGTSILLKLVRDEKHRTVTLNAGEPAGAVISQLVIYCLFQI